MKRLAKYLIVISFDAMGSEDFNKAKEYPNFIRFLEGASYSNDVSSISPSLTYPAHTSIITSTYPDTHGVIANTLLQVHRDSPDWYWNRDYIKSETLYDKAIENGMKVAALLWPVTAKSKIQYNFPEIFANRPWQNQILVSLSNGSPLYQFKLNQKFKHLRDGISQPKLDDFVEASTLYTIKELKPNLVLAHFVDLDSMRHHYGYGSTQADDGLKRHDKRLGAILDLLEQEGMMEETVVVVLGDHDQKSVHSTISLRRLFSQNGLMKYEGNKLVDYKLITKTADGSSYIYLNDKSYINKVRDILSEFKGSTNAIKSIHEKEAINSYRADPEADFLVDANEGYYFTDKLEELVLNKVETIEGQAKEGYLLSSHGYLSDDPSYKTVFMIKGPGIRKNYNIGPMSLVDEGVTFAKILGLELSGAEGKVLEDIFE